MPATITQAAQGETGASRSDCIITCKWFTRMEGAVSYPIRAVIKHTIQVTLLTEVKVSVTMNSLHSGHCVLLGAAGSLSKSRITVGAG